MGETVHFDVRSASARGTATSVPQKIFLKSISRTRERGGISQSKWNHFFSASACSVC